MLTGFSSVYQKLYHLGSRTVKCSTLFDANNKRSYKIYEELFFSLLKRAQAIAPKLKLKIDRKLFYLDASTIDLSLRLFPWARFRKTKSAVRLHTLLAADGALPVFLTITEGKTHEAKVAKYEILEQNDTCDNPNVLKDEIIFFTVYYSNKNIRIRYDLFDITMIFRTKSLHS